MNERILVEEWYSLLRAARRMFPIAAMLFIALGMIVYREGLHRTEFGFLSGVLLGILGYWAILEAMTVVRIGRLLRKAEQDSRRGNLESSSPVLPSGEKS